MNFDTDYDLLEGLRSEKTLVRNGAMRHLYQTNFPNVLHFVQNNNGAPEDAADIFQDAIIAFYTQLKTEKFTLQCSVQTYVYSIARNLWYKRLRKSQRVVSIAEDFETVDISEDQMKLLMYGERSKIIMDLMQQLGTDCQQILSYFYFDQFRIAQIQQLLGHSSEQVTKNKKSKCMKRLRKIALSSSSFKELFR
ncbi:MAG: sigma-70 family RNA polymerase sigma factor [Bacteroidota bacterium]